MIWVMLSPCITTRPGPCTQYGVSYSGSCCCPCMAGLDLCVILVPSPAGGQWEKARDLFDLMQQQGCTPDVVTYTALISAFERGGKWQLALQVLRRSF